VDFTREGVQLRTLYRRKDGPSPGTKAGRREVEQLARSGLTAALEAPRRRRGGGPRHERVSGKGGRSRFAHSLTRFREADESESRSEAEGSVTWT
jgi:hypothetical protein